MTAHTPRPAWYSSDAPDPRLATGAPSKWGFLATGNIADSMAHDLALLNDAELYATSSRSAAKAESFAQKHGFTVSYGDDDDSPGYIKLVSDPFVDIVYIASPHGQHFDHAQAALSAGKHVLCEKALTITAAEAQELIRLASENNVFLMEAVWTRFTPGFQRAQQILESGEIGDVKWVHSDLGFPATADRSSRIWAREAGGGALLDLTVYPLQWALLGLGHPDSVHAEGVLTSWGVDAQNALTLSYNNGAHAQLMSSLLAQCTREASLCGTAGIVSTLGAPNNPTGLSVRAQWQGSGFSVVRDELFEPVGIGYTYQLREVMWCIQRQLLQSPTMPLADSLATMQLFDQVRGQLGVRYPNDERFD